MNPLPVPEQPLPTATNRFILRRYAARLLWLGWLLAVTVSIGLTIFGIPARYREIVAVTGQPFMPQVIPVSLMLGVNILLVMLYTIAGLWIVRLRGRTPMALFLALTLITVAGSETGITGTLVSPIYGVEWPWLHWLVLTQGAIAMCGALLLLFLFPSGRFVPGWTQWLALAWVVLMLTWLLVPALPFNPLNGPVWRATPLASFVVGCSWFATGIGAQVYRYRHVSTLVERQQIKWTLFGLASAVVGGVLYYGILALAQDGRWGAAWPFFLYTTARPLIQALFMALLPVSLVVAIMRYRLFDIDLILNRTLVYGGLTGLVIGLYVVVVGGLSALFHGGDWFFSLIATGLVAVVFNPLRERLQRAANRLLYGERDDPYLVLSRLGQRLAATTTPEATLNGVVETVVQALKLPYAAVTLDQHGQTELAAEYPLRSADQPSAVAWDLLRLPLTYQGQPVGQMLLAARAADAPLSSADLRLLNDIARQAGVAAHAVQLQGNLQRTAAALQQAREHLVTAREEERRRLRRDLHDGLGPTLARFVMQVEQAREALPPQADASDAILRPLTGEAQSAIADIRRLVYELRPPDLDEYGLVSALREYLHHRQTKSTTILFTAPEQLPMLPAAVEVAAYRIVQEAANNVLKHAQASEMAVNLTLTSDLPNSLALQIEISDNGVGLAANHPVGVGLHSMRERAEELGGHWKITARADGGTLVRAALPLPELKR
ncbi:MAG: sensor histidine kinase [Caldilineales bacterium]